VKHPNDFNETGGADRAQAEQKPLGTRSSRTGKKAGRIPIVPDAGNQDGGGMKRLFLIGVAYR